MRKILTLLMFLVSIAVLLPTGAAQSQPQFSPGLLQRVAALKKTVPNDLIYKIFFGEMAAREKHAADLERAGKHATAADYRDRARQIMQVPSEQVAPLKAAALECAAELDSYDQQERTLVQSLPRPGAGGVTSRPLELVQLENQRAEAIARAVDRMRATLGPQAFAVTDYWIYSYISARLHRFDSYAAPSAQKGGR